MLMTEEEKHLVQGCLRENRTIQRRVWDLYSVKAYRACLEASGDKFFSEEGVLDGFVTVYDTIGKFKGEASLEDWIIDICIKETKKQQNKKKR